MQTKFASSQLADPKTRLTAGIKASFDQSDLFAELPSVVICPLTTTIRTDADLFRLEVDPSPLNGLREPSQIAIDKITVMPAAKIGGVIGKATTPCGCGSIGRSPFS